MNLLARALSLTGLLCAALVALTSCGPRLESRLSNATAIPVPTLAPAFSENAPAPSIARPAIPTVRPAAGGAQSTGAAVPTASAEQAVRPRARPTAQPIVSTLAAGAAVSTTTEIVAYPLPDLSAYYGAALRRAPVLSEQPEPQWTLEHTWGMSYELGATAYTRDGSGATAIRPYADDYGRFFLAVRPESSLVYPRDQVVGLVFWISGGDTALMNDEIAVTIVGSNFVPYYRWDDRSVLPVPGIDPEFPVFSETLLAFLDVHEIPPNTWVEVVLWLDEREFDPLYTYVTGIYFRSTETVPAFYLDDVSLLMTDQQQ